MYEYNTYQFEFGILMMKSTIELFDFELDVDIGTYKDNGIPPEKHILNLTLSIEPSLVIIEKDKMSEVFDYDPLIKEISALAREIHYETQERLITLIIKKCSAYDEIKALDLFLSKSPVSMSKVKLGVRVILNENDLNILRRQTVS